jgi:integrase
MQRRIRFTRKVIDNLPPCPADHPSREIEYTSLEAPPGLKLVVTKRGIKSWLFRYTMASGYSGQGAKRAIKVGVYPGLEPADAIRAVLEIRAQIAQGVDPQDVRRQEAEAPTLNAFFDQDYYPHAKTALRSARDVESRWRIHIAPALGNLRFRDLRPADVLRFHDAKRAQTCAATANRILALLKRVINVAIMLERCDKNPCRGVRMHPEDNIRHRTLAGDELRRFVAALAEEPNRVAADFLLFCLATAGRREECLQAEWTEMSMEEGVWRIPASRAKSGKTRVVPLNEVALQVLKARAEARNGDYVFPGRPGRHLVNPAKAFKRVLARAGIVDCKIHDLRRSAATLLLNSGGSLEQARNMLGHASSTLTATRYAFLGDDLKRDSSARLSIAITEACGLAPTTS